MEWVAAEGGFFFGEGGGVGGRQMGLGGLECQLASTKECIEQISNVSSSLAFNASPRA